MPGAGFPTKILPPLLVEKDRTQMTPSLSDAGLSTSLLDDVPTFPSPVLLASSILALGLLLNALPLYSAISEIDIGGLPNGGFDDGAGATGTRASEADTLASRTACGHRFCLKRIKVRIDEILPIY